MLEEEISTSSFFSSLKKMEEDIGSGEVSLGEGDFFIKGIERIANLAASTASSTQKLSSVSSFLGGVVYFLVAGLSFFTLGLGSFLAGGDLLLGL